MNRQEASKMAAEKPHSFLHIYWSRRSICPIRRIPYDKSIMRESRENIANFLDREFLQDEEPAVHLPPGHGRKRVQTGIIGTVSVDEYQVNTIKNMNSPAWKRNWIGSVILTYAM